MTKYFAPFLAAALTCAPDAQSQVAGMDARAQAALERMHAAYKSAQALHVKVVWSARYDGAMSRDDFPLPGPDELELRMQRPNRIYMSALSKEGRSSRYLIVSDGTTLTYWRSAGNTYVQTSAPATLAEIPRRLPDDAIGTFDGTTWTDDSIMEWEFLTSEASPISELKESGLVATLRAQEKIGNTLVDVLRLSSPSPSPMMPVTTEVTYYLDPPTGLIRRYLITVRGKHPESGKDFSVTMQAAYGVHETQPRFTDADFAFTPPPGARRVEAPRKDPQPSE
jgi:outer membrane lipoprotein-sorting protein